MKAYIDQINEDDRGVRIAALTVGRLSFTLPAVLLPAGAKEGDEVWCLFARRDNSADLAAVRELMERLSG